MLVAAGLESRGEGYRYQPDQSQASIPLFLSRSCSLSSTISSRNHRRIPVSPPLRLPVFPSFPLLLVRHRVSTFLSKSSHVPYVSLTIAEVLSACFSPLSTLTVILFPSFYPPIYLSSPLRSFPSYLFVCRFIPDFSLAVHFRLFSPSLHRPLTSCANVPKSIYDITACSRATSSPTDSTKAGAFYYLLFYFPLPLPRDIPASSTPTPLTLLQSSRQTVRYLA